MNERNINDINLNELEQIPIPEGLEARLSAKIDEWERAERKPRRIALHAPLRYAVAAAIALLFIVGYPLLRSAEGGSAPTPKDTFHDPLLAQQEAERSLNLLAANINKGMKMLERAQAISDRTEQTLSKQLNILK
ncbi:MAG: hypothetical protein K2H04_00155 [Bacteroidaceae bacterium]|nr:hypothetical protein [Bacteroidaceae bacterium]